MLPVSNQRKLQCLSLARRAAANLLSWRMICFERWHMRYEAWRGSKPVWDYQALHLHRHRRPCDHGSPGVAGDETFGELVASLPACSLDDMQLGFAQSDTIGSTESLKVRLRLRISRRKTVDTLRMLCLMGTVSYYSLSSEGSNSVLFGTIQSASNTPLGSQRVTLTSATLLTRCQHLDYMREPKVHSFFPLNQRSEDLSTTCLLPGNSYVASYSHFRHRRRPSFPWSSLISSILPHLQKVFFDSLIKSAVI